MNARNDQLKVFYIAKGFYHFRWVGGILFSLFLVLSYSGRAQSLYQIEPRDPSYGQVRRLSIPQHAEFVEFLVHRDGNLREKGQVGYSLQDISAKYGGDPSNVLIFDEVNGVLPFDIGVQKATIRVPIPDDYIETSVAQPTFGTRWFAWLELELHPVESRLDGVGPAVNFRLAYEKQESPDKNSPILEIAPEYDFVTESGDRSFIRLMRYGSAQSKLQGMVTFGSQTAEADKDFVAETILFQFAPGQTIMDVPVKVIDDTLGEGTEFIVVHLTVADAGVFDDFIKRIEIQDDEFFVDESFQPEGELENVVPGLDGSSFWATREGRLVRCDLSGRIDRSFAADLPNGFFPSLRLPLDGNGILLGRSYSSAGQNTFYRLDSDGARTGSFSFEGALVSAGWDTFNGGAHLLFRNGETVFLIRIGAEGKETRLNLPDDVSTIRNISRSAGLCVGSDGRFILWGGDSYAGDLVKNWVVCLFESGKVNSDFQPELRSGQRLLNVVCGKDREVYFVYDQSVVRVDAMGREIWSVPFDSSANSAAGAVDVLEGELVVGLHWDDVVHQSWFGHPVCSMMRFRLIDGQQTESIEVKIPDWVDWDVVVNADVRSLMPVGKRGALICGNFRSVNGVSVHGIALLRSDQDEKEMFVFQQPDPISEGDLISEITLRTKTMGENRSFNLQLEPVGVEINIDEMGLSVPETIEFSDAVRSATFPVWVEQDSLVEEDLILRLMLNGDEAGRLFVLDDDRSGSLDTSFAFELEQRDIYDYLDYTYFPGRINRMSTDQEGSLVMSGFFSVLNGILDFEFDGIARVSPLGYVDYDFSDGRGARIVGVYPDGRKLAITEVEGKRFLIRQMISGLPDPGFNAVELGEDYTGSPTVYYSKTGMNCVVRFSRYRGLGRWRDEWLVLPASGGQLTSLHFASGGPNGVRDVVWQEGGTSRLIVVTNQSQIVAYDPKGELDESFRTGKPEFLFWNGNYGSLEVVPLADGRLIVSGTFTSYQGAAREDFVVLKPDGQLDSSIVLERGIDGVVRDAATTHDGQLILVGDFTHFKGFHSPGAVRVNPDFTVDRRFSTGLGLTDMDVEAVAVGSLGGIYVGGAGIVKRLQGSFRLRILEQGLDDEGRLFVRFNTRTGYEYEIQGSGGVVMGGWDWEPTPGFVPWDETNERGRVNGDGTIVKFVFQNRPDAKQKLFRVVEYPVN